MYPQEIHYKSYTAGYLRKKYVEHSLETINTTLVGCVITVQGPTSTRYYIAATLPVKWVRLAIEQLLEGFSLPTVDSLVQSIITAKNGFWLDKYIHAYLNIHHYIMVY
jgi:hypothetical protein